jgi:hypothetical protein
MPMRNSQGFVGPKVKRWKNRPTATAAATTRIARWMGTTV